MKKLKLMTVVGTRPEVIKLSETIKLCDVVFDNTLVHTGQNYDYELNQVFFDDLGLRAPDCFLDVVGSNLGETLGNVITKSYALMLEKRPDALLILGDTNSCLCAISAKRLKIPVFHMEAGNRCFDENLPEEVNRRIVDTVSDVNICYSEHARRNLIAMGCDPARTMVVGSPMREVLEANRDNIDESNIVNHENLETGHYILLSTHREENIDNDTNYIQMIDAINALAEEYDIPILCSVHPRTKLKIEERKTSLHPNVREHKPFGFHDYIALQKNALCVVSDSGTLAEESAILGFPAVSLRTSTERPEVVDKGIFTLGSITSEGLLQAVSMEISLEGRREPVLDYTDANTSVKVVKIIQGYTDYVNHFVWGK